MSFKLRVLILALVGASAEIQAASADVFRLLASDYEAAQARVDVIDQASSSIDTSYYWIGNDRIGAMFLGRLQAAAQRGVRVRLIVDAEHNDIPLEVQGLLIRSGVAIKEFHPVSIRHLRWLSLRMHDKTLIVDGEQLIVGSRNIRNSHFGLDELNFVDRDSYLRGDAALQAVKYFNCLWNSAEVALVDLSDHGGCSRQKKQRLDLTKVGLCEPTEPVSPCVLAQMWLDAGIQTAVCCQPILSDTGTDWSQSCACAADCVCFVYDPCGKKGHPRGITRQLIGLIRSARSSIVIETPYFLMSTELKHVLVDAINRGVRVRILTNSLASTDHKLVTATFTNQKHRVLLPHGVDVWELPGPDHLHAKSAVIDGTIAFVGSYNFDPRSEFLNTETGVIVTDAAIAQCVDASIRDHMRNSYHIGSDGRDLATGAYFPNATAKDILHLESLRLIAPLIRRSL
jgi:cardiolipin synthase C